jgi:prepilin-type N-terminal cleavage/methylation domain-containing protein
MFVGASHTVSPAERGDTLVEVLISVVLVGIIASSIFYTITLGATSSKSQRDFVTADALLRNSAEATKNVVRTTCINGATTYSVAYSALPSPDSSQNWQQYYVTGQGFAIPADLTNAPCPAFTAANTTRQVSLSVTLPSGATRALNIWVRSP